MLIRLARCVRWWLEGGWHVVAILIILPICPCHSKPDIIYFTSVRPLESPILKEERNNCVGLNQYFLIVVDFLLSRSHLFSSLYRSWSVISSIDEERTNLCETLRSCFFIWYFVCGSGGCGFRKNIYTHDYEANAFNVTDIALIPTEPNGNVACFNNLFLNMV